MIVTCAISTDIRLVFHNLQGSIEGNRHSYQLDQDHTFETGRSVAACGNTAQMLGENGTSWLAKHFEMMYCTLLPH